MKSTATIVKVTTMVSLVVLLALSAFVLIDGWVGGHFDSIDTLRTYIASYGMWGPLILTLIQALQVVLPVLPGFAGCIVGGALFGVAGGYWTNYIGISAGSIVAFFLAKRYGIQLVNQLISMEKYEKYIERIKKSKSYAVMLFLSILLPLAPDDFLCYFSGLINMSSKRFILIIITAKPWCILFYSIFFAHFL
ncbi:MAG: TVP38/TMEM64 family protein [Ruminococcaceae bacterium]|nr:TVP38/TMEM64 family protein [Oscillospiraceae bacterium]